MNVNHDNKIVMQQVDGELKKLSTSGLARFLVRRANEYLPQIMDQEKPPKSFDEHSRQLSYYVLKRYLTDGQTEEFLRQVNGATENLKFRHCLVHNGEDQAPEQVELLLMEGVATPEVEVFYPLLCAIRSGEIKKLRQCQNMKCSRFFLGRPNKKWCSDRCGSIYRMKKKRKQDLIRRTETF